MPDFKPERCYFLSRILQLRLNIARAWERAFCKANNRRIDVTFYFACSDSSFRLY